MVILGVTDGKAGHTSQLIGALSFFKNDGYTIKIVKKNYSSIWKIFPMFMRVFREFLTPMDDVFPDVVVAVGNRTLPYVMRLKKQAISRGLDLKVIYLMPPTDIDLEDLVDLCFYHEYKDSLPVCLNMESIILPPQGVVLDSNLFFEEFEKPYEQFKNKKIIGISFGGNAKGVKLTKESVKTFLFDINRLYKYFDKEVAFILCTSRRTPTWFLNYCKEAFPSNFPIVFVSPNDKKASLEYKRMLANSDRIIVTGDSVSMISEACATFKAEKIYVYTSKDLPMKRFSKCHAMLYKNKIAEPFSEIFEINVRSYSRKILNINSYVSILIYNLVNKNKILRMNKEDGKK